MRHRVKDRKLGRSCAHRQALMASLVCSLIEERRIKTTVAKAKEARRLADRMVTLAKAGTLAARRRALSVLRRERPVQVLFDTIVAPCQNRNGGYTRVVKLGSRRSDSSEMALLEWVDIAPLDKKRKKKVAKTKPAE